MHGIFLTNPSYRHGQRGFTLVWVMFFVAILGVAMAAVGTVWQTTVQREKERELLFVGDQYRRAIESFWNVSLPQGQARRLPKNLEELLRDPRFPNTIRHLRRLYKDPMTGSVEWGLVKGPNPGIAGVYSLSEKAPRKTGNFPASYAIFSGARKYSSWVFQYMVGNPVVAQVGSLANDQSGESKVHSPREVGQGEAWGDSSVPFTSSRHGTDDSAEGTPFPTFETATGTGGELTRAQQLSACHSARLRDNLACGSIMERDRQAWQACMGAANRTFQACSAVR